MKKLYLTIFICFCLIGIASAQLCTKIVDDKEAVESYTATIKTPIMEDKITTTTYSNYTKYNAEMVLYQKALSDYNKLTNKTKANKPTKPVMEKINITKTTQVQKIVDKTRYRFKTSFPFIESYSVKVPQYTETQQTSSRIKSGYFLNQDTGEFYKKEKC